MRVIKFYKMLLLMGVLLLGLLMAPSERALAQSAPPEAPKSSVVDRFKFSDKSRAWDFYVFGNGEAVVQILYGIKLLMVPDKGTSNFKNLMFIIALIGFVILAVMAGFDPARNLMRMFGYIFLVWVITYLSTSFTANIKVIDVVDPTQSEVVAKTPVIVVFPATLTSQVGYFFTRTFETYFTTPSVFKMTQGAGQFNLFTKMIEESNQYGFQSAELKRSFSAYVADCMVPALALGKVSHTLKGNGGGEADTVVTGVNALISSPNLMATFKSGEHKAIMTTYYPIDAKPVNSISPVGGMGLVTTCEKAYGLLKTDVENNAKILIAKSSHAWSKAGILTPFETAFSQMVAEATRNTVPGVSNYGTANSFIMQQGFLNSMSGAFRTAALQTGNNELMQAAALSQAEAMQKSAWVSSFSVFNNMMGYVFTVLQAFIYAITPIIIIAMLVPGIGKGIFLNYAQILIWLMLWMPMLAIINFIITLFGGEASSSIIGGAAGLSHENRGLFVERNKNLVIAAQFLGTMVPMLSWGIVKGAMAFTEFISSGVGSQFASTAGQAAATGNLSMGNLQLNNASMNKFNTAQSSALGMQAVNAFAGAGAMNMGHEAGGQTTTMHGSPVEARQQLQHGLTSMMQESMSMKQTMSQIQANASTMSEARSFVDSKSFTGDRTMAHAMLDQISSSASQTAADNASLSSGQSSQNNASASVELNSASSTNNGVNVSVGLNALGTGASANQTTGVSSANRDTTGSTTTQSQSSSHDTSVSEGTSTSNGGSQSQSASTVDSLKESHSQTSQVSSSSSQSFSNTLSDAIAREQSFQESLSAMQSLTDSVGMSSGMDMQQVNNIMSELHGIRASMGSASDIHANMRDLALRSNLGDIGQYSGAGGSGPITGGSGSYTGAPSNSGSSIGGGSSNSGGSSLGGGSSSGSGGSSLGGGSSSGSGGSSVGGANTSPGFSNLSIGANVPSNMANVSNQASQTISNANTQIDTSFDTVGNTVTTHSNTSADVIDNSQLDPSTLQNNLNRINSNVNGLTPTPINVPE